MAPDYPATETEVKALVDAAPQDQVVDWFAEVAVDENPRALEALRAVLTWRADNTYGKHDIPRLAARALLCHGPEGVEVLKNMVGLAPGAIYPQAILGTLWKASRGDDDLLGILALPPAPIVDGPLSGPVDEETQRAARAAVSDLLAESLADDDRLRVAVGLMQTADIEGAEGREGPRAGGKAPSGRRPRSAPLRGRPPIRERHLAGDRRAARDRPAAVGEAAERAGNVGP